MGLARGLERRLERLVEGLSAAMFRGRLHPVDLANRLVREADLTVTEGVAGPAVPNEYEISIPAGDLDDGIDRTELVRELAATVEATAAERGWRLEGPVRVTLVERPQAPTGLSVTTGTVTGELIPWGWLVGPEGREVPLRPNRVLIGRAPDCDARFDEAELSRRHALMWREAGRIWVIDLESSNGTTLNGIAVTGATEVAPGDLVGFGPLAVSLRSA